MANNTHEEKLRDAGLKVTPQRLAVYNALKKSNHPTAEDLIEIVQKKYPSIASGTIYHIMDAFVEKDLVKKVYTHGDVMRYDAILKKHHHLHDSESDRIEDYFDNELFHLVKKHLKKQNLSGFELTDIKIKLMGKFND